MKKMNNKGFSLVELIIVIAIMAILVGVLAPQYIKFVEKSKLSTDKDNIGAIIDAIHVCATDGTITGDYEVTITTTSASGSATATADADDAVKEYIGDLGKIKLTSSKWNGNVVITYTYSTNTITVEDDGTDITANLTDYEG